MQGQPARVEQLQQDVLSSRPRTFHLFSDLPPELRRQVWLLMIPQPRIITIHVDTSFSFKSIRRGVYSPSFCRIDRHDGRGKVSAYGFSRFYDASNRRNAPLLHGRQPRYSTRGQLPSILFACRESRSVAMEIYDYCFQTYINPTCDVWKQPGAGRRVTEAASHASLHWSGILFRPKHDMIYLLQRHQSRVWDVLLCARANELCTTTIRRLAIHIECFERFTELLQGRTGFFKNLVELCLVVNDTSSNNIQWLATTRRLIAEYISIQKSKGFIFPMTIRTVRQSVLDRAAYVYPNSPLREA